MQKTILIFLMRWQCLKISIYILTCNKALRYNSFFVSKKGDLWEIYSCTVITVI